MRLAAGSNGQFTEDDLEKAATRLLAYQVIYAGDHGSRQAYELIVAHLATFQAVFQPLGRSILHRPHHGYVAMLARQRVGPRLRLSETRLGVVLRRLYNDKMRRADIDNGEIVTDLVELQQVWQDYLSLEWKFRQGELDEQLRTLKRIGIVQIRPSDEPDSPIQIVIRAAIEDVFGETVLHQLAAYGADDDKDDADETA
jgi:hypothetical protein